MAQDHFERHNHFPGVVDWNFNITFEGVSSVSTMAEAYRPLLSIPELYEPIPVHWLHATILRVGTADQYTEEEMLRVAEIVQLRVQNLHLPEFHFGAAKQLFGNICFPIEPEQELEKLYTIVTQSLASVVEPERATKSKYGRFISHASLAYTRQRDNEDVTSRVLESADIPPAHFVVRHMPLIKQRPFNGHYEWDVVKDIIIT